MRKIAQREDIRDLILDGVDDLLARYGYNKMTMEDLARLVGIGKGTIYLHFPSKEELTLSHIDRIARRVIEQLSEIAVSSASHDKRIKKMLETRVLFRFDSVRKYSQALNDLLSSLRKDLLARREAYFEKEAEVFRHVLDDGKRAGHFRFPNSHLTAQVLIWATNSLLPYSLTAQELGKRRELEQKTAAIADHLVRGLLSPRRKNPEKKQQKLLAY